ncbi:FAD-dependent oxidoreductase [Candidatus Parcubacteria bacterium]|nr:FAD-dependent oxidoreductase [Candidatus Parcubacteria bacterium]
MHDLIIIGAGPAGTAAGVYASRKKLKTLLLAYELGGQSVVSPDIQNWIGTPSISGTDLAASFKKHLDAAGKGTLTFKDGEKVTALKKEGDHFTISTEAGHSYETKTVFVASGSGRRKLDVPGAEKLEHKGITYCASCDGPLFDGQDVAVVGGGNAAFETAAQLLAYVKSVTLLNHSPGFKADPVTVEKVLAHPNMKAIDNSDVVEVKGDKFVSSLVYKNNSTGETKEIPVTGVFVEIGQTPNTAFAKGFLDFDPYGRIKIDPRTQMTSVEGVWAAGDATDVLYHQNNIAAGDAVRAIEDLYLHLHA